MSSRSRLAAIVTLAIALPWLAACGGAGADGSDVIRDEFAKDDGRLKVVTTVAPISSIVLNVGGNRIRIHGLIPGGVDSHTYEPRPSDARILGRADLLIMNGANLEGTTLKLARENLRDPSKIYLLADATLSGDDPKTGFLYDFSFPRSAGSPNPHLWMNPLYALRYAELVRDWLSAQDARNADYYQRNLDRYGAVLRQLDAAIERDQATVPPEHRKLLTYHDSWAYWARRYGWQVIGAIQPSSFKEPSARELVDLIAQIRAERVPAIFGSEVFPSRTLTTIAKESGAAFEDRLRDDDPPGKPGEPRHTYVGMLVEDMTLMFERLGGKATAVAKVPVANSFER